MSSKGFLDKENTSIEIGDTVKLASYMAGGAVYGDYQYIGNHLEGTEFVVKDLVDLHTNGLVNRESDIRYNVVVKNTAIEDHGKIPIIPCDFLAVIRGATTCNRTTLLKGV